MRSSKQPDSEATPKALLLYEARDGDGRRPDRPSYRAPEVTDRQKITAVGMLAMVVL